MSRSVEEVRALNEQRRSALNARLEAHAERVQANRAARRSRKPRVLPLAALQAKRCFHCSKPIEWVEGFGWREVGTDQGYICWHEGSGRQMAEGHEPE